MLLCVNKVEILLKFRMVLSFLRGFTAASQTVRAEGDPLSPVKGQAGSHLGFNIYGGPCISRV